MQNQNRNRCSWHLISSSATKTNGNPRFGLVPMDAITGSKDSFSLHASAAHPTTSPALDAATKQQLHSTWKQSCKQPLLLHPLPQSIAPWHTLPYCRREVSHLAAVFRGRVSRTIAQLRYSWRRQRRVARAKRAQNAHSRPEKVSDHRHRHGFNLHLPWRRHREQQGTEQHQLRIEAKQPEVLAREAKQRGLELQKALDIRGAIEAFEEAAGFVPHDAHMLACLSKQWSDITFIPETPTAEGKQCAEKGIELAGQAIALDPSCALSHIAAGVGRGRLTFFVDNRTKVKLAAAAQQDALAALAADPNNDLAYHLLGRWHFEMAQLNFVVRAMIRVVFGTALEPGTHLEALEAYQKAVELNPHRLIHRVELARTALRMGRTSLAIQELLVAEGLEIEDINAHLTRLDGLKMLTKLRRQGKLRDVLQPAIPLAAQADGTKPSDGLAGLNNSIVPSTSSAPGAHA